VGFLCESALGLTNSSLTTDEILNTKYYKYESDIDGRLVSE